MVITQGREPVLLGFQTGVPLPRQVTSVHRQAIQGNPVSLPHHMLGSEKFLR